MTHLGVPVLPLLSSGIGFISHIGHFNVTRKMAFLNLKPKFHELERRDFLCPCISFENTLWSYIPSTELITVSEVEILASYSSSCVVCVHTHATVWVWAWVDV